MRTHGHVLGAFLLFAATAAHAAQAGGDEALIDRDDQRVMATYALWTPTRT